MIDPALDGWVWGTAALFLLLLGTRAWLVETGQGRLGRTPAKVQALTGASVVVALGLVVLLTVQGGALLVTSILTGTEPNAAAPADPGAPPPVDAGAPAAPAPAPAAPAGG
jgi:hypothetical protein